MEPDARQQTWINNIYKEPQHSVRILRGQGSAIEDLESLPSFLFPSRQTILAGINVSYKKGHGQEGKKDKKQIFHGRRPDEPALYASEGPLCFCVAEQSSSDLL
jgi:hypothetical protein